MQPKSTLHHSCKLRKQQPPFWEWKLSRMPTKGQKLFFPLPLRSSNTSLASFSSPALQADTAPTSPSPHQILHQKASQSTGTISLLHFRCHFLHFSCYLPSIPGGERLPHATSRSALTQANYQSCWREITTKGPTRMTESKICWEFKEKRSNSSIKKKTRRYFNTLLSLPTPSQFAPNFSICHLSILRHSNTSSVDTRLNKAPQDNRKYRYTPFWNKELLSAKILHTVFCREWKSSFLFFYRCFQLII